MMLYRTLLAGCALLFPLASHAFARQRCRARAPMQLQCNLQTQSCTSQVVDARIHSTPHCGCTSSCPAWKTSSQATSVARRGLRLRRSRRVACYRSRSVPRQTICPSPAVAEAICQVPRCPIGSAISPYSLSSGQNAPPIVPLPQMGWNSSYCEDQFLACCQNGGPDCMIGYLFCSQVTGEPMRHAACPDEEEPPEGDD